MSLRIGVNPLCWMNSDIPSLGAHIPVEQCLAEIGLIGFTGVELEDPLRKALEAKPFLMEERGLTLIGGWHSVFVLERDIEEETRRLKEHMALLRRFGGQVVNLAEMSGACHRQPHLPLSRRPQLRPVQWPAFCEAMDRLAQTVREGGMVPAYHQHVGTVVQSEEDVDRLMEGTQMMGLLFDPGHLLYAGCDLMRVLGRHLRRISHVHAKNVRQGLLQEKRREDRDFPGAVLAGVFTVPGDNGVDDRDGVDFLSIMQQLVDVDYDGWVVMEAEQDPELADPFTYAKLGYHTLHHLLAKCRLRRKDRERGGHPSRTLQVAP